MIKANNLILKNKWILASGFIFLLVSMGLLSLTSGLIPSPAVWLTGILDRVNTFTVVFLGIFIEAVPFLLLGTLASGIVEVFFDQSSFLRMIPRSRVGAALVGSLLGMFFPVCECGVVPLARRLYRKGLPLPVGVSFLLAAPVINPIVIASTYTAFGAGWLFWGRLFFTLLIAILAGLIFSFLPEKGLMREEVLAPSFSTLEAELVEAQTGITESTSERLRRVALISVDEFFEMSRYLVIGSLLASLLQTLVPQSSLLALGQGPVLSVVVMILLAVLLSVCSTVDAFIALAFVGTFSTGSILGFLVYGPMVDIKSTLMFLQVYHRKGVAYLVLIPLFFVLVTGFAMNLLVGH